MPHPEVEPADDLETSSVHFNRIVPVYPGFERHEQRALRELAFKVSTTASVGLDEPLPEAMRTRLRLPELREALEALHFPSSEASLAELNDHRSRAHQRLAFDELFFLQLGMALRRQGVKVQAGISFKVEPAKVEQAKGLLPFALTGAQERVVGQIFKDMARPEPMNRLLQGDVGSGKTAVAMLASAIALANGYQVAVMAPTEILAEQHFRKLITWLEPLGIKTAWLTGSQKARERREALAIIASGEALLVVGTHAVIQDKVIFKNLALAIIDEQHRFGVAQRLALRSKMTDGGQEPHLLMMTATPIPRTLAMSYYADLDVSTIDELPPGRSPIVTKVVNDNRRDEVIERIRSQIAEGRQVYWVCPLIEESESIDLVNATETHEALSAALPDTLVGLLHSRMPVAEKKAVMRLFTDGLIGVLVSTTVIEVGVDVPNASLMVIEHAERFGLSQLHQLRGRVGRGAAASACVLLYSTGDAPRLGETARARLKAMVETNDGFEIARRDLEIRGPGEFLGARQSGAPLLRFADLETDAGWLAWARGVAPQMLDQYAELAHRHILRWLGGKAEFLKA
jgi:ATP-dependent DNA helicase RecG